jgi:hypothetical protein
VNPSWLEWPSDLAWWSGPILPRPDTEPLTVQRGSLAARTGDRAASAQLDSSGAIFDELAQPHPADLGVCAVWQDPQLGKIAQCLSEPLAGRSGGVLCWARHAPIILMSR